MKTIYKYVGLVTAILISNYLSAQPGHGLNIGKQQPRINGILNNVNSNARIHANSNSVFVTNNYAANYNKRDQSKKEEGKEEMKKNNKEKDKKTKR